MRAEREFNLETKFNKEIMEKLRGSKIELMKYKNQDTHLIHGVDELQVLFNEQYSIISMMKQSPFSTPIK